MKTKKPHKRCKIVWYARGGDVLRFGPFKTQAEAARALRLAKSTPDCARYPDNAFVWPEEVSP